LTAEPWQIAEIPGPVKALVIQRPEVVVEAIKKAQRSVLVAGHLSLQKLKEGTVLDYAIEIAQAAGADVVATAHVIGEAKKKGYGKVYSLSAMEIAGRLQDQYWEGLDGSGRYELALFIGLPYYMAWTILSGLKHVATHLKTISIDRYYQPHATWSFPNLTADVWEENLKAVRDLLRSPQR
jgi:acetyl-CoA decarbonylase/synthase complex subunit epsilon